jgi:hypothetical protein
VRKDVDGNRHPETALEHAALCLRWSEGRGVRMSVSRDGTITVDSNGADITPLTDEEFEGWVRSVADALRQILIARRQPPTVH